MSSSSSAYDSNYEVLLENRPCSKRDVNELRHDCTVDIIAKGLRDHYSQVPISLAVLTSRFEATRGLFWDGLRNFERSDDEDDTRAGTSSPNLDATTAVAWPTRLIQRDGPSVESGLEPGTSGPKAETSPLGHRGLY
ncbi:hypothetical protein AVEN_41097-1 [Araneus ventricosus]|uniref:Uncharacterized protein n=1 Tax=Araneus ventricosus TaxID=182803 RepID=A0A4Y2E837_ARAVE|nr:hypothetical protein AVEN_41097-1 [Araneus ventricosus]